MSPAVDLHKADSMVNVARQSLKREKLVTALQQYGEMLMEHKQFREALKPLIEALDLSVKNTYQKLVPGIRLDLGKAEREQNHLVQADQWFREALTGFVSLADTGGIAESFNQMGSLAWKRDSLVAAHHLFMKSHILYQISKDTAGMIRTGLNLGFICREQNNNREARSFYSEVLQLAERSGDTAAVGTGLHHMGGLFQRERNFDSALVFYSEALKWRNSIHDLPGMGQTWLNIAQVKRDLGNKNEAESAFDSAIFYAEINADLIFFTGVLSQAGTFYLKNGEFVKAHELFLRSLDSCLVLGENVSISQSYASLGSLFKQVQNPVMGLQYFQKAIGILKKTENKRKLPYYLNELGNIYFDKPDPDSALICYKESLKEAQRFNDYREIAVASKNIGRALSELGQTEKAAGYLQKAEDLYRQEKDRSGLMETLNEKVNLLQHTGKELEALNVLKEITEIASASSDNLRLSQALRKTGEILTLHDRLTEAENLLMKSLDLSRKLGRADIEKTGYFSLYLFYKRKGETGKALQNLENYRLLEDSLATQNMEKQVLLRQAGYEMSMEENLRHAVEHKMVLQQALIHRQRITVMLLVITFLLVLALMVLIYNRYLLRKKAARLALEKISITEETNRQLKISEESLRKLNHTKDKFFSIIAHDLRSPLSGLVAFTDLVAQRGKDLPKEELLDINLQLNTASRNLFGLLDNLLHWARSQTGKIPFNPELNDVVVLAATTLDLLKSQANNKSIHLEVNSPGNAVAFCDRNMILLVLRNLVSNAIKFTPTAGKVIIDLSVVTGYLRVKVIDNGVGMGPSVLARLFRLEEQVSTRGTANEPGSGLGLILCKEFVEQHGGEIHAESTIGEGSRFIFSLPLSDPKHQNTDQEVLN